MSTTIAEVLRRFGPEYLRAHTLSTAQAKAWRAIVSCRTSALGGQLLRCEGCGHEVWRWHSCRNRHCPQCQSQARDAWRQARLRELLDVPYCHLVFTLPHELNGLAAFHGRWVYETLINCVAATLTDFAANPRWLGAVAAFTLVLHTWTQDLRRHLHVHALMSCGGLQWTDDGQATWVSPRRGAGFLFPVQALSRAFRGKFMEALNGALHAGKLARDPDGERADERERALWAQDWVVYAKTPLAGPAAVVDYLSRYTHRTAIGNERLLAIAADRVKIKTREGRTDIAGLDFIGRLLQHVLPSGFKRIRHCGLLAPAAKKARLALARRLLEMPQPNAALIEDARAFMKRIAAMDLARCPHCAGGTLRVVKDVAAEIKKLPRLAATHSGVPP